MMQVFDVPTGNIAIMDGDHGKLECLYVGDYGKNANMKADFLGLREDVSAPTGLLMPLSEKIVVTISTQYGCASKCKFCDVPKCGPGRNATYNDLLMQIREMIVLSDCAFTKRLNIHFARMGEPTWNTNVLKCALLLPESVQDIIQARVTHPVVSTMLPKKNKYLGTFLRKWCAIKNLAFDGDAGLQFSINSTHEGQRDWLFGGSSLSLEEISELESTLPPPLGRKYTLNFCVNEKTIIDAEKLVGLFNPNRWIVKLTPVHNANEAKANGVYGDFWYSQHEENCKKAGFDVIVFVPSEDEESGRITCGNALLASQ